MISRAKAELSVSDPVWQAIVGKATQRTRPAQELIDEELREPW